MQGQSGTSNSIPEAYYLAYGSNAINLHNDVVPVVALVHGGHLIMDSTDDTTAILNSDAPIRFQDLLGEDEFLYPPRVGPDQRLQESHNEVNMSSFQHMFHVNPGNGHPINEPSVFQGLRTNALLQNIDLNVAYEGRGIHANQEMRGGLCLNPFKQGAPNVDHHTHAGDSSNSNPLVISSGISGYVLEENEGGDGPSDGRRLSCKRKTPIDFLGQLSLGERSGAVQQCGTYQQHSFDVEANAMRNLNMSTPMNYSSVFHPEQSVYGQFGVATAPSMHEHASTIRNGLVDGVASSYLQQFQNVVGQPTEIPQRNIRPRRTIDPYDYVPSNLPVMATRNPNSLSPSQPTIYHPFEYVPSRRSTPTIAYPTDSHMYFPCSSQFIQPFQLNGDTRLRNPPLPSYTVNGGDVFYLEENSSGGLSNVMLPSDLQSRMVVGLPANLNFPNGASIHEIMAYNSRNANNSHGYQSFDPTWSSQSSMVDQYDQTQIILDFINRNARQTQGGQHPIFSASNNVAREIESALSGNGSRYFHIPPRSIFRRMPRRSSVVQIRNRLISEVRNALTLLRRGGSIPLEELLVFDPEFYELVPDDEDDGDEEDDDEDEEDEDEEEDDIHEDMRLDVDNMSYEELLDLENRIGDVIVGLSEDSILVHLKRKKYQTVTSGTPKKHEACCICQEDFADGDDLGKLKCEHKYHFDCIKQWLREKNCCPICKRRALDT